MQNLRFTGIRNALIKDVISHDSKMFHINLLRCKNMTLQSILINGPPSTLNTDAIHITRSSNINITHADIATGDDGLSIGDDCQHIHVEKLTCVTGNGLSVGSLGRYQDEGPVTGVTVKNCTFLNTEDGVMIKTWPNSPTGIASSLQFEDIVMGNVSNPIVINQEYCPYGSCKRQVPSRVRINGVVFKNITGTTASKTAIMLSCSKTMPCQNVQLSDINVQYTGKDGPAVAQISNVQPTILGTVFPPVQAKMPNVETSTKANIKPG
ncbi:hypothetical protein Ancab_010825 [Ancistrocladus abbreviatus]